MSATRSSGEVFSAIVVEMGYDNNCRFNTSAAQLDKGEQAVGVMRAYGCEFTEDEIQMVATGETSEVEELFCRYRGWEELNRILNEIFEGDIS